MVYCNMCVVLLSMKRDFVREMKKDMEIFRDMAAMKGVSDYGR